MTPSRRTYLMGYDKLSGLKVPCPPKRKMAGETPGASDELKDPPRKRNRSTGISFNKILVNTGTVTDC